MSRLNPEVFDFHHRRAKALRTAAVRAWNPLVWVGTACRSAYRALAQFATARLP